MTHQPVAGELLATRYAEAPLVRMTGSGGVAEIGMEYPASVRQEPGGQWITKLEFLHVLHFEFHDWEIGLPRQDPQDFAFHLIEMRSSQLLQSFKETRTLEQTAIPVTKLSDLMHFRIGFDDHGLYDVVCVQIKVRSWQKGALPLKD